MKQKNVVLVVVAVVCGLAAAVLTSQMSAGSKKPADTIPVLVAVKDIPVGTRLAKEELDNYLETKSFTKETVPQQYIATKEDMADKRTTRTIRKGDSFNPHDLTKFASLNPPKGFNMMSIHCTLEQGVSGFAGPGAKVDVLASIPVRDRRKQQNGETIPYVVPLFIDMLVLAVDSQAQVSPESNVVPTMSMVSMAVTPEQSLLMHAAVNRNCALRLVLRNQEQTPNYERVFTHKELWSILANEPEFDADPAEGKLPDQGEKVEKVKIAFAREDLPAGLQLTAEAITDKFEMKEVAKPLPPQAIENLRDHTGKYLTSKLSAGQFVPKSFVGDKEAKPAPTPADGAKPKFAPPADPAAPAAPAAPKKGETPPVFHDFTVQSPNGVKKYRYQKLPNGEFKFLGEVPHDGNPDRVPAADESKAKPKADPQAEPKADPKPEPKGEKRGEPISAR